MAHQEPIAESPAALVIEKRHDVLLGSDGVALYYLELA